MAGFFELVSNFENLRDYIRDFYIYGFKTRVDFQQKSTRTYDNEKRRIESYLGRYVQWEYTKEGKSSFLSMDSSHLLYNPFHNTWKAKRFSDNDVHLHFYILDTLRSNSPQSINSITDNVCRISGILFDTQTVRNKCNHYAKLGLVLVEKNGRAMEYSIATDSFSCISSVPEKLSEAIAFFQGAAPFGVIGSFLLDQQGYKNKHYLYKHKYLVHTLEDGVLFDIVSAMRQKRSISFQNLSKRTGITMDVHGIPVKVLVNTQSGRRYLCLQDFYGRHRSLRLDSMKNVKLGEIVVDYDDKIADFSRFYDKVWGASLGRGTTLETLCMKLYINEKTERYVLERLAREGRGGEIIRLEPNIFLYTKEAYDVKEISTWIKTFYGRILGFETTDRDLYTRFFRDIYEVERLYR